MDLGVRLIYRKWQERHVPGAFNCDGYGALMFGAGTRYTPGQDFTALGRKCPAQLRIFIVYMVNFTCTKLAYAFFSASAFFLLYHMLPPSM